MFYLLHFWCSTLHSMKSAQHCQSLVKVDVLNTCGAMICSCFRIAFLLFLMKIENTVYSSFQNSTLLLINGLIFDIMNIQNNQSLEFEWIPMIVSLRSVNDWRFFHGCVIFSLSLSKIGWIRFSNVKEPLQKMLVRKCSFRGKHMKDWKEELKLPNFFFDFRLSMYWTPLSRSSRKLVW